MNQCCDILEYCDRLYQEYVRPLRGRQLNCIHSFRTLCEIVRVRRLDCKWHELPHQEKCIKCGKCFRM